MINEKTKEWHDEMLKTLQKALANIHFFKNFPLYKNDNLKNLEYTIDVWTIVLDYSRSKSKVWIAVALDSRYVAEAVLDNKTGKLTNVTFLDDNVTSGQEKILRTDRCDTLPVLHSMLETAIAKCNEIQDCIDDCQKGASYGI